MKTRFCFLAIAVLAAVVSNTPASDRRPLRSAQSENERFRLRIRPGRPQRGEAGRCHATLFDRGGESRRARELWTRTLANEVAPAYALIRGDGRFVVTLDEFRRGGGAHAVVIYDERGKQLREFDVRELLVRDDWKNVSIERQAVEWLPGATFAFVDTPPQFVIRLKWGREIRIDLEKLAIAGEETPADGAAGEDAKVEQAAADVGSGIPAEILALLEQATSAPATAVETTDEPSAEAVQRALEELQRMAEVSGVKVEGLDRAPAADAETASAARRSATAAGELPSADSVGEPALFAGNRAATGVPVPIPDPANPVDYVAWVLAQTETDGPSAVPLYEAAIDSLVKWEGDRDLYDAALRGDPEALASPEITEWLEANQEALANFQAATELEYRGMLEVGEDYTLIGILLPSLSPRRHLARAAIIEAKRLEADGQVDAALGNYLDNLAAGAQVSQGPTLIENLLGIAIQAQTGDSLLDSFASPSSESIDYVQLAQDLGSRYRPPRPIAETFQGERAMVLDFIQQSYDWDPDAGRYRVSPDGVQFLAQIFADPEPNPLRATVTAFMLGAIGFENLVAQANHHYDALTEAAMLPYPDAKRAFDALEERVGSTAFQMQNPVLAVLVPSLGRANHLATRAATARQATRLITSLKAYRQQYGTYPDSLDVFGDAEMLVDPFTDQSFAYRRDGEDFRLYSLGGNGVDDGGIHDRRGDKNDVVFWPRPPKE
ncbi:MAG: hypothetical protein ACE5I3_10235 [Phycisphaerae bacterium]